MAFGCEDPDRGGRRPSYLSGRLCKLLALEEDFEVVAQAQMPQVLEVLQQHEPTFSCSTSRCRAWMA